MAASDRRTREVERAVVDATEAWLLRGRVGAGLLRRGRRRRGRQGHGRPRRPRRPRPLHGCGPAAGHPGAASGSRRPTSPRARSGSPRHDAGVPYLTSRLQGFGTTVFAEMSALAVATGSVNLGQGFPDYPGPPEVLDVARAAIGTAADQYPPGPGRPELRAGDRRPRAAVPRPGLRPRRRGPGDRRRHRGAQRRAARAARHRRRGRAVRADVRLLRGGRSRWPAAWRGRCRCGRRGRRRAVDLRPGGGARGDHPAGEDPAAQHPAQPDRQGLHRRGAAVPRGRWRSRTT